MQAGATVALPHKYAAKYPHRFCQRAGSELLRALAPISLDYSRIFEMAAIQQRNDPGSSACRR